MGAFEDVLGEGMPEPEVHIYLPGKVGTADKGGDTAQASTASVAGRPSDSQTSSGTPEPEPQLPEGSDPDEPDDLDTAEEDVADAAAAGAAALEMFKAEAAQDGRDDESEGAAAEGSDADDSGEAAEATDAPQLVVPRKGGGLRFEGESVNLKYFPRALVDQMRLILSTHLGDDFARDLSQFSIVTAFVIAAMGAEITTDEYTAAAVKAFRANDPKADAIDRRTAQLLEQQTRSEGMLKAVLGKLGDVMETAAVLEMGQAYALSERTAQLDTTGTLPETIDVAQKRVVVARDNIRRRVKAQRQDERIRDGRPIR